MRPVGHCGRWSLLALGTSVASFAERAGRCAVQAIRSSTYAQVVSRVSERDASAMLAFVSELKEPDEPLPFPPRLLAGLQKLIASDSVWYSELDPVERGSILQVSHTADGADALAWGNDFYGSARELWWRLRDTHPLCGYRTVSGDWTTARKVSDFATLREFRRTPIYDAFYRGVSGVVSDHPPIDRWLDVGLTAAPTRTRVFIFVRHKRPDFDERDRLIANLLQPHLAARAVAAEAALQAAGALAAVEEGANEEAHRVVLCSPTGVIEFASPASRALLERYQLIENGRLAAALLRRRDLALARADRRLQVRIARTGDLHVLMVDERDTRIETLTGRERQILEHVARGKENDEIALQLGLAPPTVAKHLEHVYRKLGVPNRTAAAARLDNH
jgi:DNA-binding CsgD family transcriptional regulator